MLTSSSPPPLPHSCPTGAVPDKPAEGRYCTLCAHRGTGPNTKATIDLYYPIYAQNIVQLAIAVPTLSTLVTALVDAKLTNTLSGEGPFTVFAPNNAAFAKIPAATLKHLLDPKYVAELTQVLELHVVSGAAFAKDLKNGEKLTTLNSLELTVTIAGGLVFISSSGTPASRVIAPDNGASNGVVHIVDTVLLPGVAPGPSPGPGPPGPSPTGKNIVALAQSVPTLSTLVTVLIAANLTDALSSAESEFTVFAPNNAAFAKIPAADLKDLLTPANIGSLTEVLTLHVVKGSYLAIDLTNNQTLKTLATNNRAGFEIGSELTVTKDASGISIASIGTKTSKVIAADNVASNGVVHVVDTVMLTEAPFNHLWFHLVNFRIEGDDAEQLRCGDLDASLEFHMPASIFHSPVQLALYTEVTLALGLSFGRCAETTEYTVNAHRTINTPWILDDNAIEKVCETYCHCKIGNPFGPSCGDTPDEPSQGHFCSLCGPARNGIVDAVNVWVKPSSTLL
tara:strand:- start:1588 stop:3114 length:1527 start_codon:yes stop_codon:yes gene_type:complete